MCVDIAVKDRGGDTVEAPKIRPMAGKRYAATGYWYSRYYRQDLAFSTTHVSNLWKKECE